MKLCALKCPNCGASIEIEDEIDAFYCKYCGYKIVVNDLSDAEINAKVKIKSMKHHEKMQEKKYANDKEKWALKERSASNSAKRVFIIVMLSVLSGIIVFGGLIVIPKNASNRQEKELNAIVDEVLQDIENEDYDVARVKAEKIYYTAGWSSEIEEKWDSVREELIDQINKAEKQSKKESGESSFWDFFK